MKSRLTTALTIIMIAGLFSLISPPSKVCAEDLPSVEDILQRYIDVIGGREAIEKLSSRICIGKETTDLTSRQQPIYESHYFEAYAATSGKMYKEVWTDAEIYRVGFDGETGWVRDKCGVEPKDYVGHDRLAWVLNPHNALVIEEYFPNLTVTGTTQARGMTVYVLESPEFHRPLFFDKATGLLIGFGHNWEIHDYREVDGVLFPHKILESRKGGSTVIEFSEVRHNEEINDSLFVMPTE